MAYIVMVLFDRILLPLDGSEHSERALETGIDLADRFGSKMTLLHVYSVSVDCLQKSYSAEKIEELSFLQF